MAALLTFGAVAAGAQESGRQVTDVTGSQEAAALSGTSNDADGVPMFRSWAQTPPMGWNSWDCYYSTVNEKLVLQNARYQRDNLLEYGWEYVVIDIRWYANHPSLPLSREGRSQRGF